MFHGELITELVGIGIPGRGIDRKGNPNERQAVAGTRRVAAVVTFGIPTLTVVPVQGT